MLDRQKHGESARIRIGLLCRQHGIAESGVMLVENRTEKRLMEMVRLSPRSDRSWEERLFVRWSGSAGRDIVKISPLMSNGAQVA